MTAVRQAWLALEQTRLLAKAGQSVALVCYSRGLAHFLERVVAGWKPAERPYYVGLFHELPVRWGAPTGRENDSAWFEEELPSLLGDLAADRPVRTVSTASWSTRGRTSPGPGGRPPCLP